MKLIDGHAMIQRVEALHKRGAVDLPYYNIVKEAVQMEPVVDAGADLISRAAAKEAIHDKIVSASTVVRMWNILDSVPAVDAVPVVHGRWINIPDKPEWDQKMCSVCGDYFCCQGNYCPNCGAKMDLQTDH